MATHGRTHSGREQATPRTLAVCPGQSPLASALALLVLGVLCGCAHTSPSPLSEVTQAQLGTIGVIAAPVPPEVDYRTPGRGGVGGAAIGTAKGLGLGIGGATVCFLTLGRMPDACVVAVATPYFVARYAVDQATEGVSADAIAASETAIQAVLGARHHEAVVGAEVFRLAAVHPRHQLMPLPDAGLPSAAETAEYKPLTASGFDTVIEVTLQRVALQSRTPTRVGGKRIESIWSISAAELNPYLTLVVTARTRVLKTTDGAALYEHSRDYIGQGATFTDWGANDGQPLREGLAQLLQETAGEIITQVFGVAVPPVREPDAPAAPNLEQAPAPPAEPSASDAERPTSD